MTTIKRRTKSQVRIDKHPDGATAVQFDGADGSQIVVCDGLRVLITKEQGAWLAQGLEIDYAVDGESLADVKNRFMDGLARTIESNVRAYGNLNALLRIAPQQVWTQWNDAKNKLRRFKSTTMIAKPTPQQTLPFDHVLFLDASKAA